MTLEDIRKRYAEPWRHYHTMKHVAEVMTLGHRLAEERGIDVDPQVIDMFALFHDCVYIPNNGDNEVRSAELWRKYATEQHMPRDIVRTVSDLILLTATPEAARAPLQIAMVDADWHMMSQPVDHEWLEQYEQGIRAEYADASAEDYAEGRLAFIDNAVENELMHEDNANYLRHLLSCGTKAMTKDELLGVLNALRTKLRSTDGDPNAPVVILDPLQECNCVYAVNGVSVSRVYLCKGTHKFTVD